MAFEIPRVVRIKLREPLGKAGGRYSTSTACLAFTEMTFSLAQISRQNDSEIVHNTRIWYRKPQSEYTDRQFNSLFAFVRDECLRLNIVGIIVDSAHHFDVYTMQRLMDIRRLLKHQLALILSARIERSGGINEQLSTVMNVVIDPDEVEDGIELKPLTREETCGKVLIAILKGLNVDFAPSLTIREVAMMRNAFWNETLGDWHTIAKRQRRLKDLVGPNRGQRRFLTRDVFEAVMGKPLPPLPDEPSQQPTSSP
jgi:hypothetical protein